MLVILFLLLSIEKATGSEEIAHIAGYEGIVRGRTVFPLGAPTK